MYFYLESIQSLRKLPQQNWVLFYLTLLNRLGTMVLPFLLLYLTKKQGIVASKASEIFILYGITQIFSSLISGVLCDVIGSKKILLVSLVGSTIALFAFPYLHHFFYIKVMLVIFAFFSEAFRPAALAIVGHINPPSDKKLAFAFHRLAINLGMSIGPLIGGFLVLYSYHYIFFVDGLTSLLAAWIAFYFLENSNGQVKRGQNAHPYFSAFQDWRLCSFIFATIPVGLIFLQYGSTFSLFIVTELKHSEALYGALICVNALLILFFEIPLNVLIKSYNPQKLLPIGALLVGLGFGILAFNSNMFTLILSVNIWTIGEMIFFPTASQRISELAPPSKQGTYMGIYTMSFGVSSALGPWLGTLFYENFGSNILWQACLILGFISACMLYFFHFRENLSLKF